MRLGEIIYTYILADTDDTVAVLFDSIQQIPCSWLARDSSTTVSTDALTPTPTVSIERRKIVISCYDSGMSVRIFCRYECHVKG